MIVERVGIPLQGNGKFDKGAYYVVGHLLKLIVLSAIINNYLVRVKSKSQSEELSTSRGAWYQSLKKRRINSIRDNSKYEKRKNRFK